MVENALADGNFIQVNLPLAQKIGFDEAALLQLLMGLIKHERAKGTDVDNLGYFQQQNRIAETFNWTEKHVRNVVKSLLHQGMLLSEKRGIPARNFYKIRYENVLNTLSTDLPLNEIEPVTPKGRTSSEEQKVCLDQIDPVTPKGRTCTVEKGALVLSKRADIITVSNNSSNNNSSIKEELYNIGSIVEEELKVYGTKEWDGKSFPLTQHNLDKYSTHDKILIMHSMVSADFKSLNTFQKTKVVEFKKHLKPTK